MVVYVGGQSLSLMVGTGVLGLLGWYWQREPASVVSAFEDRGPSHALPGSVT